MVHRAPARSWGAMDHVESWWVCAYTHFLSWGVMDHVRTSIFDNIEDLKKLTFDQFLKNLANIWRNSYVTCLIEGNFHKEHAIEMFELVTKKLHINDNSKKMNWVPKVKLTKEPLCLKVENLNKADGNR